MNATNVLLGLVVLLLFLTSAVAALGDRLRRTDGKLAAFGAAKGGVR